MTMHTATSYKEAGELPLEELLDLYHEVVEWMKKTAPKPPQKVR